MPSGGGGDENRTKDYDSLTMGERSKAVNGANLLPAGGRFGLKNLFAVGEEDQGKSQKERTLQNSGRNPQKRGGRKCFHCNKEMSPFPRGLE